jgi:hypothetical protein
MTPDSIPGDGSLTLTGHDPAPYTFQLFRAPGAPMVTLYPDGTLAYADDYTPDAAAKAFWEALAHTQPLSALHRELEETRQQVTRALMRHPSLFKPADPLTGPVNGTIAPESCTHRDEVEDPFEPGTTIRAAKIFYTVRDRHGAKHVVPSSDDMRLRPTLSLVHDAAQPEAPADA